MLNPVGMHPSHKCPTGELGSTICSNRFGKASKPCGLFQHSGHVQSSNAVVYRNIHAFVCFVIEQTQSKYYTYVI